MTGKKLITIPGIIILTIGIIITVITTLPFFLHNPQIQLNKDAVYKIYEEESIKIPFSQWMNKNSVEKSLSTSPKIPFNTKWQGNTLLIDINSKERTGNLVSVNISENAKNILGRKISNAFSVDFITSKPPKVLHIHPREKTNITEKIYITFTDEMADLNNPSMIHSISLSPPIKGTWNWITPSTIEFSPKNNFDYSTVYKIFISKNITNLNGIRLEDNYEYEFKTEDSETDKESENPDNREESENPLPQPPLNQTDEKGTEENDVISLDLEKRRAILLNPDAQVESLLTDSENINEPKLYSYIHLDKKIYSPNDTILFKGIVKSHKDAAFDIPKPTLINIAVRDSDSFEIFRNRYITNKKGVFDGKIKLFDDSPSGTYTIIICLGTMDYYCQEEEYYSYFSVGDSGNGAKNSHLINQIKNPSKNALKLELDKDEYQIGETARLRFKYNEEARALITVERSSVKYFKIIDVSPGYSAVQIPIKDNFFPNTFVSVLVVEKDGTQKNGKQEMMINKESRKINLTIETDKTRYNPGEEMTLSINTRDYKNRPISADLLLYIQEYSDKKEKIEEEVFDFFYHPRNLNVIDTINTETVANSKTENITETMIWKPNIHTDINGEAKIIFKTPNKNSLWKIKILAISDQAKIGFITKKLDTRKSLILNSNIPNFLYLDDQVQIKTAIENNSEEKETFSVNIETVNLTVHGNNETKIKLDPHETSEVIFDLEAQSANFSSYGKIKIRTFNENKEDQIEKNIQIIQPIKSKHENISGKTGSNSFQKTIHINAGKNDTEKISINAGATYLANIVDDIKYLLSNPMISTIDTIGRIAPIAELITTLKLKSFEELSLPSLRDKAGNKILFEDIVKSSLQKIYELQNSDGGWNFWKFETEKIQSNSTLSAFILSQLHNTRNAGFYVNQNTMNKAYKFVANTLYNSKETEDENQDIWESRAFLIAMLSEANRYELRLIQKTYENIDELSNGAKLYLALALENTNQKTKATEIVNGLLEKLHRSKDKTRLLENKKEPAEILMSDIKRTALLLKLIHRLNIENPEEENMIQWILNQSSEKISLIDRVEIISMITEIIDTKKDKEVQFSVEIELNNLKIQAFSKNKNTIFAQESVSIPVSKLNSTNDPAIKISKKGIGRLFFEIINPITTDINKLTASSNRIGIARTYLNTETKANLGNLAIVKQGDTVTGEIILVIPEERNFVMVEEFLPAGLTFIKEVSDNKKMSPFDIHKFQNNRILLFAEKLSPGVYTYSFEAKATRIGKFFHQQTKAFEVYNPKISSTTKPGWFSIAAN